MKYRNPKKDNDLFSMLDHQQEVMRTVKGINKLNAVIDWELFRSDLETLLGYVVQTSLQYGPLCIPAPIGLKVSGNA